MGILARLSSFKPKFITHTIATAEGDQEFKFYPVPTRMLVSRELRSSIGPIVEVLQSVMGGPAASATERHVEQTPEGGIYEVTKASSVQTIDFMENLRRQATAKALDTFLSDETRYTVGRLIGASLRDEFPSMKEAEAFQSTVVEFMDSPNLDVAVLMSFIVGFLKANAAVLGLDADSDVGKLIRSRIKEAMGNRINDPVAPASDDIPGSIEAKEETPSEEDAAGKL